MAVITINNPKPTRHQNTVRQVPPSVSTAPPSTGATIGASPPSAIMIDITLASRSPFATSTTTARATTAAKPPPKPCTTRNAMSNQIDGANAQPTAPRVQISPPTIIGIRRPRWSDSGPPSSCPNAMPRKNVVKVRPTSDAEVARSAVTCGKAGVYMSVANGGTALCKASVNNKDVETAAPPARARLADATVGRGEESSRAVMTTPLETSSATNWSECIPRIVVSVVGSRYGPGHVGTGDPGVHGRGSIARLRTASPGGPAHRLHPAGH